MNGNDVLGQAQMTVMFQVVWLVIRIVITVYCVNKAGKLTRNKGGWGFFGFFLPIIALIWIQFMKPMNEN